MELTPSEQDRLLLFTAGQLAKSRLARGLKLNKPEAVAIISNAVVEAARDGGSHSEALSAGLTALSSADLLPGVSAMLGEIYVEAVFSDGRRLVVVNFENYDTEYPGKVTRLTHRSSTKKDFVHLKVKNESEVPISVTSHMHFMEVNPKLRFKRESAYGMRLNIQSGTQQEFPPHEIVDIQLIPIEGARILIGFAGIVDGRLDAPDGLTVAMKRLAQFGYLTGDPS